MPIFSSANALNLDENSIFVVWWKIKKKIFYNKILLFSDPEKTQGKREYAGS